MFLLFEGLDREQWLHKLNESRDAYSALRDHFMKYIEHPDDLESTVDPLADDEQVCCTPCWSQKLAYADLPDRLLLMD